MRFFTSDTHFGDTRILRAAKRPFKTIAEHDAYLIARWQATVRPDDEVWHLGDVAPRYSMDRLGALLDGLPGTKHLITGNNDDAVTRAHSAWASVSDYAELEEGGIQCNCAITPSALGTAWVAARSTCTVIHTPC